MVEEVKNKGGAPPGNRDVAKHVWKHGVPGAIRTPGPLLRRQLLYPLSYRDNSRDHSNLA